uniref:Uncharacterized protein n=1 Tax=Peronospora matthiolae TaxID=2874970 RepID=A0AAV1UP31_9STRA
MAGIKVRRRRPEEIPVGIIFKLKQNESSNSIINFRSVICHCSATQACREKSAPSEKGGYLYWQARVG